MGLQKTQAQVFSAAIFFAWNFQLHSVTRCFRILHMKKLFKIPLIALAAIIFIPVAFILFLTVIEYRPKEIEDVKIERTLEGPQNPLVSAEQNLSIVSWNIGYGCLGDNADFFMDGGKMVKTADKKRLAQNMDEIYSTLAKFSPDFIFMQEVDINSTRSSHFNEKEFLAEKFAAHQGAFGVNFKTLFVPYPMPPIGKVHSGIQTLSKFHMEDAKRQRLPCPFKWPLKIANLKRCLLITRLPVENSSKELVLINLHLEAYDSGEGKIMQTNLLRQVIENETSKGNYVIAGGDFNQIFSTTDNSAYPVIDENFWQPAFIDAKDFDSSLTFVQDSSSPTCRSLDKPLAGAAQPFQYYMIDGFIVSSNVQVNQVETVNLNFRPSDHNPVRMEFTLIE